MFLTNWSIELGDLVFPPSMNRRKFLLSSAINEIGKPFE